MLWHRDSEYSYIIPSHKELKPRRGRHWETYSPESNVKLGNINLNCKWQTVAKSLMWSQRPVGHALFFMYKETYGRCNIMTHKLIAKQHKYYCDSLYAKIISSHIFEHKYSSGTHTTKTKFALTNIIHDIKQEEYSG